MLVINGRDRPMRAASSSCVTSNSSSSCWLGRGLLQWIQLRAVDVLQQRIAQHAVIGGLSHDGGMVARPACWAARHRRSPMTSWYRGPPGWPGIERTTIGCMSPNSRMECTSSVSASSSNTCRGCAGSAR